MLISSQFATPPILLVIIGVGVLWSYVSAGDIQSSSSIKTCFLLGGLVLGVGALNYRALTSVIPWRGDESTFIVRTRDLMSRVPVEFAILASLFFALIVFAVARKSTWMVVGSVLLEAYTIFGFFQNSPFKRIGAVLLLRWPYVNYWFYAFVPYVAEYVWDPNHEFLYRVIPLVSAAGLVWIVVRQLRGSSILVKCLVGFSIATMPIVFYYSSILYIEPLAVLLMVIVCFSADDLLRNDFKVIRHSPGWLALVLVGFIKETVVVFLLCFLACRSVFSLQGLLKRSDIDLTNKIKSYLMSEVPVFFCVLYPYILYMAFRVYLIDIRGGIRSYNPDLTNWFNPALYGITWHSFTVQFAIFFPLFIGGLLLLFWRKDYQLAVFILSVFIAVPLFYGLDTNSQPYIGYSRFNLYVLPPILVGSVAALNQISKWGKIWGVSLVCIAIVMNLAFSPIYLDGTKVPFWGNYVFDTSEHYYPYDQALLWLKNNHGSQRILFSEMFYNYYLSFYFAKFDWHPAYGVQLSARNADEAVALSNALSKADQGGFGLVLYQVKENFLPAPGSTGDFCLEKIFKTGHTCCYYSQMPLIAQKQPGRSA